FRYVDDRGRHFGQGRVPRGRVRAGNRYFGGRVGFPCRRVAEGGVGSSPIGDREKHRRVPAVRYFVRFRGTGRRTRQKNLAGVVGDLGWAGGSDRYRRVGPTRVG